MRKPLETDSIPPSTLDPCAFWQALIELTRGSHPEVIARRLSQAFDSQPRYEEGYMDFLRKAEDLPHPVTVCLQSKLEKDYRKWKFTMAAESCATPGVLADIAMFFQVSKTGNRFHTEIEVQSMILYCYIIS